MPKAVERALADGCDSLQVFTKSSSQWKGKELSREECDDFGRAVDRARLPVITHGSYLINLASPDPLLWRKSVTALADELERCDRLRIPFLVLHPGSTTRDGSEDDGIGRVAAAIDDVFEARPALAADLLLENTAGQGACIGWRFEHLAAIRAAAKHGRRVGICFDTCHAFAAGYDLRRVEGYEAMWSAFDRVVGLRHLRAFHLNDSKKDLNCRVDRHAWIGDGFLGKEPFRLLVNDPRFADHPAVLETPPLENGEMSFKLNLKRLRRLEKRS